MHSARQLGGQFDTSGEKHESTRFMDDLAKEEGTAPSGTCVR